ncbi:MAG: 4Fe-4S binding protein, partial [Eubacteriales bacterium]|nr:4Fe-4S binding protein [Eubacteriales bacterium]
DYRSCLDYASQVPGNDSVMIGMADREQVDRAVEYFEQALPENYVPDVSGKQLMVDQSDCEGCGTCKNRCVSQAIFWNDQGLAEIDPSKCVHCGYCAPVCPVRAIIFL